MRAHFGWLHALLCRIHQIGAFRVFRPFFKRLIDSLDARTQRKSLAFDQRYGTQTYGRIDVPVEENKVAAPVWGYSAINHDFFREIIRAIKQPLERYVFVDVGSGKGAAVLMAGEFPFKRLVGIELNHELVEDARRNTIAFNRTSGLNLQPQWDEGDFFKWALPNEPAVYFFNNPFPADLTLVALRHLESKLLESKHPALLVFRKLPKTSGDYLYQSSIWHPVKLAPYWRIYAINQD